MWMPPSTCARRGNLGSRQWSSRWIAESAPIDRRRYDGLDGVDLDLELADKASGLRAKYGLKTPDAIQIAATLQAGGAAFLTNDPILKRVTEIEILMLDDLVDGRANSKKQNQEKK